MALLNVLGGIKTIRPLFYSKYVYKKNASGVGDPSVLSVISPNDSLAKISDTPLLVKLAPLARRVRRFQAHF